MSATARLGLASLVLGLALPGCLRTKFDLCVQDPPDPNCAYLDAGTDTGASDAGADAGAADAGAADAGADAGNDAGNDAGATDAGATDAGHDAALDAPVSD